MTYEEINTMLVSTGLPVSYFKFPDKVVPEPPFIVFNYPNTITEAADNTNYCTIVTLSVQLYTDNKDIATEKKVEAALNLHNFVYNKTESYIFTDDMYEVSYEGDIVINYG